MPFGAKAYCLDPAPVRLAGRRVGLARRSSRGVGFFDDAPIGSVDVWAEIAEHYDINGLDETDALDAVIKAAQHLYKLSLNQTDVVDFDDMVLWPLIKNIRVKFTRDVIFIDEAQDISRARQALVRKFLTPGGQLHIIGDDRQAIYGFSGADADALPNMIEALDSVILPLTVTFRCPKAVVRARAADRARPRSVRTTRRKAK